MQAIPKKKRRLYGFAVSADQLVQEVHHVAVVDDIGLAFGAQLAGFARAASPPSAT